MQAPSTRLNYNRSTTISPNNNYNNNNNTQSPTAREQSGASARAPAAAASATRSAPQQARPFHSDCVGERISRSVRHVFALAQRQKKEAHSRRQRWVIEQLAIEN